MKLRRMLLASATALGVFALATIGSANAAPLTFTWAPGATTPALPGGTITNANNFNVADFADIVANTTTGAFTEHAVINIVQFLFNGSPVASSGLGAGGTYSLYAVVTATGNQGTPIPANGSGGSISGAFTSATYTFFGSPSGPITVTNNPGGTPTITGNAGAIALFGGTLINGTTTLTAPAGGGFSPTANLNLTLSACAAAGQVLPDGTVCSGNETGFFSAPPPSKFAMVVSNFSATTSVTTLTPGSPNTLIDINGGGGNVTFAPVPEPTSLLLLGSGLLALGAMRRRKQS